MEDPKIVKVSTCSLSGLSLNHWHCFRAIRMRDNRTTIYIPYMPKDCHFNPFIDVWRVFAGTQKRYLFSLKISEYKLQRNSINV